MLVYASDGGLFRNRNGRKKGPSGTEKDGVARLFPEAENGQFAEKDLQKERICAIMMMLS